MGTASAAGPDGSVEDLTARYEAYLDCLNRRAWHELEIHVADSVVYNGERIGLSGYDRLLRRDTTQVPDLRFHAGVLVVQPPHVAARLEFDCSPQGSFLGLEVSGRRVSFTENVIYRYEGSRIGQVWSVIDRAAIARQLAGDES